MNCLEMLGERIKNRELDGDTLEELQESYNRCFEAYNNLNCMHLKLLWYLTHLDGNGIFLKLLNVACERYEARKHHFELTQELIDIVGGKKDGE